MLRSTGFFRGIDCPFFKEYGDDKEGDKHGCKRPYCHFRHSSQHRRTSLGATKQRDLQSKHKEQGYDPYNPEVTRHEEQQNGDSSASGDFNGALELVKQQIEAVRTQVEREKRKLSQIGDDEYEPSSSASLPAQVETVKKRASPAAVTSHLAYDPGSYQMSTVDYNPTPGCSKYTLDSDSLGNHANSMEYVPTSVKKSAPQTYTPQLPSPHAPKYSNHKSSSKCKYTLDNSKPSTDMEYDPLSNYSATIAGKIKRDETARAAKVGVGKAHKLSGSGRISTDEEYIPTVKKPRQQKDESAAKVEVSKAHKVSGSGRLSTDDEYVPTTVKKPRQQREESAQAAKIEVGKAHKVSGLGRLSTDDEYVPTPVKKPRQQKDESAQAAKIEVSKAHKVSGSGRLSTDDEYVPTMVKKPRQLREESAQGAKIEVGKSVKLSGSSRLSTDDEYVPTAKKPLQQNMDKQKYTFSDSEEESSGTEYRPISLSSLQRKKGNGGSVEDAVGAGRKEVREGALSMLTQRSKEESREQGGVAEEWDSWDDSLQKDKEKNENEKVVSKSIHKKSSKCEKAQKVEKDLGKTSCSSHSGNHGNISNSKDKMLTKKPGCESLKKDGNSQGKKDDGKSKVKSNDKVLMEGREQKRNDGKVKITERVKGDLGKREKDTENGGGESKKPKSLDKEKERIRQKDHHHKNGKLDSSRREKDTKKSSKSVSSSSSKSMSNSSSRNVKGSSLSIKDKVKKSSSSSDGNLSVKKKRRVESLSHADLFGDESPDEMEPVDEDDDDDDDDKEVVARTLDSTLKQGGGLNKRKASEITVSSSEDEGDCGAEEDIDYGEVDFSTLQADVDFDSDPMEECLRIFNESKDVKNQDKGRQAKQPSRDSEDEEESTLTTLVPGQKKRVSHFAVQGNTEATPKVRPYKRPSAQEMCYQRMQIAQQQAAQLAAAVKSASASLSPSPGCSGERKRIAHRPNPLPGSSTKYDAKPASSRVLTPSTNLTAHLSVKTHTFTGIMSKTSTTIAQKRVAHTPTMKSSSMKRPIIPTEFGAKVPTNVRQRYLNTFIDECVKFCPSEDAAFQMALDEEKIVYDRSNSKNIYLNVAVNTLKKLRGKSNFSPSPVHKAPAYPGNRKAQSHEEVLGGRLAAKTSFTINRMGRQQEEKLTEVVLYRKLQDYLMTEEQLQEHGYPRSNPDTAGRAVIHNLPEKKTPADPFTKICCRCGAEYRINANGNCVRKEECNHHWGRLRRHKVSGGWETNYSCCSGAVGAPGCQVAKQHMQDGRKESLDGYVTTFSKQLPADGNGGVYALDCEMCYTKQGLDLTRVTVINSELKVIYDTFVKPDSQVVDYNTRFSGVTEEDLESATITIRDVQAVLLSMFSAESILVGHSLESDLLALKLIHSMVVDTAIVFPHRLGLPYKRALRNLMADHLKRIIQDNVEGHDSSEDAAACMELMVWKLKEDAKVKR